jgi:hypothetical protein
LRWHYAFWLLASGFWLLLPLSAQHQNIASCSPSLPRAVRLVAGTGGALTNFVLLASDCATIDGRTNVSIRAVAGGMAGLVCQGSLDVTNLSGANRTLQWSEATNHFTFAGTYGTNMPSVLTNQTRFHADWIINGSNTLVFYAYLALP